MTIVSTIENGTDVQGSGSDNNSNNNLLTLGELSPGEFKTVLDLAEVFRAERNARRFVHQIKGTTLALLFEKPSTRTRVSFDVAMFELGGHAVMLDLNQMQSSRGETPQDTARALSCFCHGIAARVSSHETLLAFAESSNVPVINALSDIFHPCQAIADVQTVKQCKKKLKGINLSWIGDGNNVCNSLLIASALAGVNMTVACPQGYSPLDKAISISMDIAEQTGSLIQVIHEPKEAARGADVIVTDTFVSMGQDGEKEERMKTFLPEFQVDEKLFSLSKENSIFMHCLPAHRGEEVVPAVIDGPRSVIWQEAENRLHTQKAVLYSLLKKFSVKI